jgi:predicted acylesterase/phospholipase RssA
VIAVDLIQERDPVFDASARGGLSQGPWIHDIVLRSLFISTFRTSAEQRRDAELVILPPVAGFHFLDFSSFDALLEVGYRAGQQALAGGWSAPDRRQPIGDNYSCRS